MKQLQTFLNAIPRQKAVKRGVGESMKKGVQMILADRTVFGGIAKGEIGV
jgi:hypothetical protein